MPAVRPTWGELPEALRALAGEELSAPPEEITAASQDGGFSPGAALRLAAPNGRRLFLKAIPTDHPMAVAYAAEAVVLGALPVAPWVPRLLWVREAAGWLAMAQQDVAGRHPDLSHGSPDVPVAVAGVARMAAQLADWTAATVGVEPVKVPRGWRDLTAGDLEGRPWAAEHLADLARMEQEWSDAAQGPALVHNDIRPDNLLITTATVVVVDWAQAKAGHPWRDLASLVPHLIMAGHTPASAEAALSGVPAWDDAPGELVTGNAVALAGYLVKSSALPPPPGVPHLRDYQARAAAAVCAWVRHRTGI